MKKIFFVSYLLTIILTSQLNAQSFSNERMNVLPISYNLNMEGTSKHTDFFSSFGNFGGVTTKAVVEETCAYDKQMCTAEPNSPMARLTNSTGMLGNALKNVLGDADWEYNDGLYPSLKKTPGLATYTFMDAASYIAASPVFLRINSDSDFDTYDKVRYCFSVSIQNGVKWKNTEGRVEINNKTGVVRLLEKGWDTLIAYIELPIPEAERIPGQDTFDVLSKMIPIKITGLNNDECPSAFVLELKTSPSNIGVVTGDGEYEKDELATITATTDNEYYIFKHWEDIAGKVISSEAEYIFPMTSDSTLIAVFNKYKMVLTLEKNIPDGGKVTGAGTYNCDSNVKITAVPNDCYMFRHWKDVAGKIISSEPEYMFDITSDTTLIAVFQLKEFAVTIYAEPSFMGNITGGTTGLYNCGTELNLIAETTNDSLYEFIHWTDGKNNILRKEPKISVIIESDTTIIAVFDIIGGVLEDDIFDISIVPNPTDNDFNIIFENTEEQKIKVELLDIEGKKLLDIFDDIASAGTQTYPITTKLPSGTYLVKFVIAGKQVVRKVVVR